MILGRHPLSGQLVYTNCTPICRPCWNGYHHMCLVQADKFNKCECSVWRYTKEEHAEVVKSRRKAKR